jgi:hypothetical protein
MSVDNRTIINDCEANTGWTGDDSANVITTGGSVFQGTNALATQLSDSDEQMHTTEDSVSTGTFSLDWSDSTLYMLIKDNLNDSNANGGIQFVIGDAGDLIGYDVGGYDNIGLPLRFFYYSYKLDVSVRVATPGSDLTNYTGTEANLDQTVITRIGYGSLHIAKAVGAIDNVIMDCFRYIANDSYALTINAGTSGTPETMADVQGDDETNGWGMVANPIGTQFIIYAPTEFGESAANADHYFTASGEQWYLSGGNAGAGHFIFRVIGNATDIGSFVIDNVAIVGAGTRFDFDMSNTDIDTLELDGCSFTAGDAIGAPSSGGTSRFCINTIFNNCGVVTHNGADMSGGSVLVSNVAADIGALLYNESSDPDTVMDGMTFSMGAASHHAIDFGTTVTSDITLRGCNFTGFGNTDDSNDSTVRFLATSGSLTLNLIGCTVDGADATTSNFSVDDAAGITVTVSISVSVTITVKDTDGVAIQNVQTAVYLTSDRTEILNGDTNGSGVITGSFGGATPAEVEVRCRKGSSGATRYKNFSSIQTIAATTGLTLAVTMFVDPNNNATS